MDVVLTLGKADTRFGDPWRSPRETLRL